MSRWAKRLAIGLPVALLLLLLGAGVLGYGLAQSDAGKRQLAGLIERALGPDADVALGDFGGSLADIRLDRLAVRDEAGLWLTAENLRLAWTPLALFRGRLRIGEVSAERLTVERLPAADEDMEPPESGMPRSFALPGLPWPLRAVELERLAVGRLALGAPLLGEAAVFRVDGTLSTRDPREEFALQASLVRLDEQTATLDVKASLAPRPEAASLLTLAVEAEETGGLLPAVAGAPPASELHLTLAGEAPVNHWRGRLVADAGGLGSIDAGFGLQGAPDLSHFVASADGRLTISPELLPDAGAALARSDAQFAFRLRRPEGQERLVLEQASATAGPAAAQATGSIDLAAQTVEGDFRLTLADLSILERLAARPLAGELTAAGQVSGALSRPDAVLDLTMDRLRTEGISVGQLTAHLRFGGLAGDAQSGWRIDGDGAITGLAVEGATLPEEGFAWRAIAVLPSRGPITVSNLEVDGDAFALTGSGGFVPADRRFSAEAVLDIKDLQHLAGPAAADLPASPRLRLSAAGTFGDILTAKLDGQIDRLSPLPPSIAPLVGAAIDFTANARLDAGDRLAISDLRIATAAGELTGAGQLDLQQETVQADLDMSVPQLAALSPAIGAPLEGALTANAEIGGTLSAPALAVEALAGDVLYQGRRFARVAATATARDLLAEPAGRIRLSTAFDGRGYELASGFRLAENRRLLLSDLELKAPATSIAGDLAIDVQDFSVDGRLQGGTSDLAAFSQFVDGELGGRANVELRFKSAKDGQAVALTLAGRDLVSPYARVEQAEIHADVGNVFRDPSGTATVRAGGIQREGLAVKALTLDLRGGLDRLAFSAAANGTAGDPFQVRTAGSLTLPPQASRLSLTSLDGSMAGEPFKLAVPATFQFVGDEIAIDRLALDAAGGRVTLSGRYGPQAVDLEAGLAHLPLTLVERLGGPALLGQASARLDLSGTPAQPRAELNVDLEDVKPAARIYRDTPPMTLAINGSLRDDRLDLRLLAERLFDDPVTARASLPVELSLQPFDIWLPRSQDIDASIQGRGDLERLTTLLLLDDQIVEGQVDIELDVAGTLGRPQLSGGVTIEKGQYQNLVTGTVLANIEAAIAARGTELVMERLAATDGSSGTVTGRGSVNLAMDQALPVALDVAFSEAVLLRQDEAIARTSGRLSLDGGLGEAAALRGNLTIGPAEVRLPERLPPSIVDLNVTYISESGEVIVPETEEGVALTEALALDVDVAAERVFVRGRGLESEWHGRLRVGGTGAEPTVEGQLEVRRGFLDFLGRRLDLASGRLSFSGESPPSPYIEAVATTSLEGGATARITIRGELDSPELVVSSEPELPQDEVLARLLFGRVLSRVTPLQAVKLAAAVNTLRGGGGMDLVGRARELLGVDVVDITQAENSGTTAGAGNGGQQGSLGGTTVGIGKYVTDNVYVEAKRGVEAKSGAVSVEIEVTPNVTVETEVGANSQAGIGLKWEWNY